MSRFKFVLAAGMLALLISIAFSALYRFTGLFGATEFRNRYNSIDRGMDIAEVNAVLGKEYEGSENKGTKVRRWMSSDNMESIGIIFENDMVMRKYYASARPFTAWDGQPFK